MQVSWHWPFTTFEHTNMSHFKIWIITHNTHIVSSAEPCSTSESSACAYRCAIPANASNYSSYLSTGQFPPVDAPWVNETQLLLLTPSGELGSVIRTAPHQKQQQVFGSNGLSQSVDLLGLVPPQPLPLLPGDYKTYHVFELHYFIASTMCNCWEA
jgi:hypothetical protein